MERHVLEFEKPISDVEARIVSLKAYASEHDIDVSEQIQELETMLQQVMTDVFSRLRPWDQVQMARHPRRPYTADYCRLIFEEFVELHGDRRFGDDAAMIGGLATLAGVPVMVVGHQKGRDARERAKRNFGSAKPEGYRKALRLGKLAEKFKRPLICFIDTPAADCSVESEERGISEAIAENMREMFLLRTPTVAIVIGEGGSGGAVGIGTTDRVLMLEHSIFSVIPPESCAAILWRDKDRAPEAADALKLNAENALRFGVIDEIIAEPLGGAHRDVEATSDSISTALTRTLVELSDLPLDMLLERRYQRFRKLGEFEEPLAAAAPEKLDRTVA